MQRGKIRNLVIVMVLSSLVAPFEVLAQPRRETIRTLFQRPEFHGNAFAGAYGFLGLLVMGKFTYDIKKELKNGEAVQQKTVDQKVKAGAQCGWSDLEEFVLGNRWVWPF